jgi:hypothetical protein
MVYFVPSQHLQDHTQNIGHRIESSREEVNEIDANFPFRELFSHKGK